MSHVELDSEATYLNDRWAVLTPRRSGGNGYCVIRHPDSRKAIKGVTRILARFIGLPKDDERLALSRLIAATPAMFDVLCDIAKNFDCDNDAHRYGTTCRACAAAEVINLAIQGSQSEKGATK